MEAGRQDVDVKWLYARRADVAPLPDAALQPLTPRDLVLLRTMQADRRFDAYAQELAAMGAKVLHPRCLLPAACCLLPAAASACAAPWFHGYAEI